MEVNVTLAVQCSGGEESEEKEDRVRLAVMGIRVGNGG